MRTFLFAILQVILASGLLYAYYHFFLRNSRFHQYNRFYLLMAAVISIIIPFINIPVYFTAPEENTDAMWQVLRMMSSEGTAVTVTAQKESGPLLSWQQGLYIIYGIVALFFLVRIVLALRTIRQLIKQHQAEEVGTIKFVNTTEPTAPFSFFRWLFWNKSIDITAPEGQQIFRHEVFHINQRHSYDILFFEALTTLGWINPFFHLMKKELRTIHEFLADKYAASDSDKWAYAELLLMQALQTRQRLVHPFFQSQIKRRIAMITSSTQPAYQYLRKILVLPVAASVVTLFAFSYKEIKNESLAEIVGAENMLPVVADTTKPGEKVDIVADKIVFKTTQKTAVPPASKTTSLYVINDKPYTREVFESSFGKDAIVEAKQVVSYSPNNTEAINLYGSDAKGGVLVFKDAFVTKPDKPEVVNVTIRGVRTLDKEPLYVIDGVVQKKGSAELTLKDLNPNSIEVINVLKSAAATAKYGEDANEGVVEIITKSADKKALRIEEVKQVQGHLIAVSETQPSFKGGDREWRKFLERNLNGNIPVQNNAPAGTYKVDLQFVVDKNGAVRDVKALTNNGYGMEEEAVRLLKNSPEWEPAKQGGRAVAMYRTQPISFVVIDENAKPAEPLKEVVVTGYARSRTQGNEPIKITGTGTMQEVVVEGFPTKAATAGNIAMDEVVVVGYSSKKVEVDPKTIEGLALIYPNPASHAATVSVKAAKSGTGHIRIADMNGNILSVQKVALTAGTSNYTINTSGLSKGTYLVSVSTDEGKTPLKAMKLIKE